MSEWRKIRIQDYYKEAVGEEEYTYVTPEVMRYWRTLSEKKRMQSRCGI